MAQPSERPKRRGPSSLTTAVLAAVVEQSSHGYEINNRLNVRMAPTWTFDRRRVYDALGELEADGLVWSEAARSKDSPAGWRRVFHATSHGQQMCAVRMQEGGAVSPMRGDIHAWMTLSRPEEAEQILAKLEEYEKDCMEIAEDSGEPGVRSVSWRTRMLKQHQAAIREQYLCRLRCIKRARLEIEEYLAEQR